MSGDRVARVDRWRVRYDAKDLKADSRGFVQIWGTVVSADQILEYGPEDGHEEGHTELVPEGTVFDEASLATLRNAPITFLHPAEPVNSDNSVRLTVGHIVDVKRDGNRLRALHQIEDSLTLQRIKEGVIELSPGYTTLLEATSDMVVDGRQVHAIQRERVYNHQAIVPEARAGPGNSLTIDSAVLPAGGLRIQQKGPVMAQYAVDGKTWEVDEGLLKHIKSLKSDAGEDDKDDAGDDEEESDDAKDGDDSNKDAEGDEDEDEEESEDAKDGDDDAKDAKDGDPPSASNDGKVDAASIAAEVTKVVLAAMRTDQDETRATAAKTASIIAAARPALPQSFSFEGKSDAKIMRKAMHERDPDTTTAVKELRGDALYGAFVMAMSASTGSRSDSSMRVQATSRRDASTKVFDLQQARLDAVQNCGACGSEAMRHADVTRAKAQ